MFLARNIFSEQNGAFLHIAVCQQRSLHFSQFNAEPTDFHLLVNAPQTLYGSILTVTSQITRSVHSRARRMAEGIGNKTLCRQVRSLDVTARQALAARVQLARHTQRHRL